MTCPFWLICKFLNGVPLARALASIGDALSIRLLSVNGLKVRLPVGMPPPSLVCTTGVMSIQPLCFVSLHSPSMPSILRKEAAVAVRVVIRNRVRDIFISFEFIVYALLVINQKNFVFRTGTLDPLRERKLQKCG